MGILLHAGAVPEAVREGMGLLLAVAQAQH
jgi:hypothetical protein